MKQKLETLQDRAMRITGCLPNQGNQGKIRGKSGKNQGNACRLKNIREKSGNSAKSGENQGKIREKSGKNQGKIREIVYL